MSPIPNTRKERTDCGVTLIEMMIVIVLVSLLVGVISMVYQAGFSTFYTHNLRIGVKGESSRAFFTMGQELRQADSLVTAQQTSLSFTADTDSNGSDETIQYSWTGGAGSALQRISGGATTTLINSVNSLAFSYYDAGNNLLSFPVTVSQVKMIRINVTVTSQDETFALRSQVNLRNL